MVERRANASGSVVALPLGEAFALQSTKPPQKRRERHCHASGCNVVLSQYNPDDRCSIHAFKKIKPIRAGAGD
jgi:hypothetical protein